MKKGDIINCLPNVIHWHGAMPKNAMVHIVIGTSAQKGKVVWMGYMSDIKYESFK